ncbi:hypothetical protein [Enterococcus mundtii]|uniref:hypothetical protein n=1 Tax=Enterococcus mundtii TaxID=53346 RepID=UPI00149550FB|nr:hypothetical protein [Enterococcus mundtii]
MIAKYTPENQEERSESQNLGRGLPIRAQGSTEDKKLFLELLQQMQEDHPEDE